MPPTPGVVATTAARHRDGRRGRTATSSSAARVPAELAGARQRRHHSIRRAARQADLRLAIEGDGTGTLDSDDREVVIPDLTAHEVMLTTPRLVRAHRARIQTLTRACRRPDGDARVPPHRSLLIRLTRYAPAAAPTTVTARLLNQQGRRWRISPSPRRPRPDLFDRSTARQPRAGQYLLEISGRAKARSPHGTDRVSSGELTIVAERGTTSAEAGLQSRVRDLILRLRLLRVHAAHLRDRRHAIDRDDVGGRAHVDLVPLRRREHGVERLEHLRLEALVHFLLGPEIAVAILHPFEI